MIVKVVLDIAARAIDKAFSYRVNDTSKDAVCLGSCVLVNFGGKPSLAYVVECIKTEDYIQSEEFLALKNKESKKNYTPSLFSSAQSEDEEILERSLKPILQNLSYNAFDEDSLKLARFIASYYAAYLSETIKLFLAPGARFSLKRTEDGSYELIAPKTKAKEERWVALDTAATDYELPKNASRQRQVLDALREGPVKSSELSAEIPGASSVIKALEKKSVVKSYELRTFRELETSTLSSAKSIKRKSKELSQGQKDALSAISQALTSEGGKVILLDGVTGSGKTEVYLQAIEEVLKEGKSALCLVPEISLTAQTVGRFRGRFGEQVAVLHSRLSDGERFDQWELAKSGHARVVVGARSALFAPLQNLGLIIIDEEHEASYKQSSGVRYHARLVAEKLAQIKGIPLVLGSATSAIESLYAVKRGQGQFLAWQKVDMPERVNKKPLPKVEIVDMTTEFASGHRSMFSRPLLSVLERVCEHKEKAVMLLNRRGFAHFLLCRECGYVPKCKHCSSSLTYHERSQSLECHTCGSSYPVPKLCPECGSVYLRSFGSGTQRVEDELNAILDEKACVFRMDADSTKGKFGHEKVLEAFDNESCAVLLGTQMIAKGLDFPEVTLAAVINADTTLKAPDFRAAEKTYSLLEQFAGRAGRGDKEGSVIVQSYWADHPALQAIKSHDRDLFLQEELEVRKEALYPPYVKLCNLIMWSKKESSLTAKIMEVASNLKGLIAQRQLDSIRILGPSSCVIAKAKDYYRYHMLIKCPLDFDVASLVLEAISQSGVQRDIKLAIDVDPYDFM